MVKDYPCGSSRSQSSLGNDFDVERTVQASCSATTHPPIMDIDRVGLKNPGSLIACPGIFPTRPSKSERDHVVVRPSRIRSRSECSSSENKQFRIAPSAVSRSRLHVPQKGCVTLEMSPISPWPSTNANRSAGAELWLPIASSGQRAEISSKISLPTRVGNCPTYPARRGHEFDEANDATRLACERGKVQYLVVVLPRNITTFNFSGVSPAASTAPSPRGPSGDRPGDESN